MEDITSAVMESYQSDLWNTSNSGVFLGVSDYQDKNSRIRLGFCAVKFPTDVNCLSIAP